MDKPKSKVVKSKSSNSAITTKSEPRKNKKSRSNAEILQPLILKKRGVYVEKKATKISINEQELSPVAIPKKPSSPRPIPRPGRKRFLASVLTILSQSTTGTQYPDQDDPDRPRRPEKTKTKLKKKKDSEIIQEDTLITPNSSKRKPKYRSRVLNANDSEIEQLVVLQSTKEITHTPSNYSEKSNAFKDSSNTSKEPETIKWADILPPLVKNTNLEVAPPEDVAKELQDKSKEKRVRLIDRDPSTLVAEVPRKDEKKLYNFFVDLLETTFSVYNVKTEFNPPPLPSSVNSSKVALEMDESVAKKLNLHKVRQCSAHDVTTKPSSKYFYCIKPDETEPWDDKQLLQHFQPSKSSKRSRTGTTSPPKSLKRKRRLLSQSFDYKKAKPIPKANSLTIPRKILLRRNRKKDFLNSLKEQLKMEDDAFEEPQNFYQALKVIARNKRRCRKSIHFQDSKKPSEGDVHICQFKRRRVLSASTKSSGRKSSYQPESDLIRSMRSISRNSDFTSSTKRKTMTITETEVDPSQHSIEVFGFDYETPVKKLPHVDRDFESFHTSTSTSVQDYNINEALLKYSDSGTSSNMMPSVSHLPGKHGLRSLSELLE